MIRNFFRKNGWRYIPGFFLMLLCSYLQTRAPLALGRAVSAVGGDWQEFIRQTLLIFLIALSVFITRFGWRWFIIRTSREMEVYLRDNFYTHICRLPVSYFTSVRSGDLMAYAVNDVNAVRQMFGMVFAQCVNSLSSLIFSIGEMSSGINASLTLYALLPVPAAAAIVLGLGGAVRRRARKAQEAFTLLSGHVQENINGMRVIKAFAREEDQCRQYEQESLNKQKANIRWYFAAHFMNPAIKTVFGISYAVGIIYGGKLVMNGTLSLASYIAFNSYLTMIVNPIMALGRINNNLQKGIASYKRLQEVMRVPEIPETEREIEKEELKPTVKAENLSFRYEDGDQNALTDVSFELKEGKMLGIAGPTGSGKSTLLSLILKLSPASRGSLFVGGRDINDIPAATVRAQCGYVPQDGFLFKQSILENVQFFSNATQEEAFRALTTAGMAEDLAAFAEGVDKPCGERGTALSGGQRQRVALARALVRKPRLMLLDDTLSAVDAETEETILHNLSKELHGVSCVVVAHRLSALRYADEILYMENGRVTERGTHEQLLALGGEYARMFALQHKNENGEGKRYGESGQ